MGKILEVRELSQSEKVGTLILQGTLFGLEEPRIVQGGILC